MAKQRYIQCDYWKDDYIHGLLPDEKLIYTFLITNGDTSLCGIYKMPINEISFRTGIKIDDVQMVLGKFEGNNKVFYTAGWVYIRNFIKYVVNKTDKISPTILKGIEFGINNVPEEIITTIFNWDKEFKLKYSKFLK